MRGLLIAAAAAAAWLAAGAAEANDLGRIEACLANAEPTGREACIGIVALPCLDRPEAFSTHGSVACIEGEVALWDQLLNVDYRRLMGNLDGPQQEALRTAQRAWIALRDADCFFPQELIRGTMAQPMTADCRLEMTARRVLWLRDQIDFRAEFR